MIDWAERPQIRRVAARVGRRLLLAVTAVTDWIPPRYRFGHWQRVLRLLALRNELRSIPLAVPADERAPAMSPAARQDVRTVAPSMRCLIVAGALDGGGIEAVVSMLARGLPSRGIGIEVVCSPGGRVAAELRAAGVMVTEIARERLGALVSLRNPDVVQLHRMDADLMGMLAEAGPPTVPVFHAMESYVNARTWTALAGLVANSSLAVAVSEAVREFFAGHLPASVSIRVVLNAAPQIVVGGRPDRLGSREALGAALDVDLNHSDVVVSLLRFSDQKNAPGLVDAFLLASESAPRLHLVVAGSPDSWLEVRMADMIRRGHPNGARIHLLGNSDAATLFAAADLFALNSFAEGGPIAAVEAVSYGLPVVLSDVGFARELVACDGVRGRVVPRANLRMSQASIAGQRRSVHQRNRAEFAQAIVEMSRLGAGPGCVPPEFALDAMLDAHAAVLRSAVLQVRKPGLKPDADAGPVG